jgi:hypothetical protein
MSHDQLKILRRAAAPLRPEDRDESLRVVADRLRTCPELGNGVVFRVARNVQSELLRPVGKDFPP